MMKQSSYCLFLVLAWFGVSFSGAAAPKVKLERIYPELRTENPLGLMIPDDGTNRRFLVEQTGLIRILPADESAAEAKTFIDFKDRMGVEKKFEEGLLGLAFHPKYKENGKFYVYYSKQGPKRSVVSEFQVSKDDPDKADPSSERILFEIQQPEWNHNSGNMFFHPNDGFLYIMVGDGGARNGVFQLAQKKTRWNGKVLRIDVDSRSGDREYGIPADNPFVDDPIACPEIWATGLRNPWGVDVDEKTGLFYLADVGQNLWEEINIIEKGGNYGWEHREGATDFEGRAKLMAALGVANKKPKGETLIDPIHQYGRDPMNGGISITGGFVYHGKSIPALAGHFIYGDWRYGNIWALHYDPESKKVTNHFIHQPDNPLEPKAQPTGFYPDENGEPIVLGWKGEIFRIVPDQ